MGLYIFGSLCTELFLAQVYPHTTQDVDNQPLKCTDCRFPFTKTLFTLFCYYTIFAEKQVKSNFIHAMMTNVHISIKNINT